MPATAPTLTLHDWMPADATWAGVVVLLSLGLLFAAAFIGPIVKMLETPGPASRARRGK